MRIAAYRACDPLDRLVFGARVRRNQRTIGERFAVIWSVSDGRLGLFESPFVISFVIELNESLQPVTIPLADARHVFVSKGFLLKFVGKLQVPFGLAAKSQIRSEEHTSDLQSLMRISYAVFCLKKKK